MTKAILIVGGCIWLIGLAACSSNDQEKAKAEARDAGARLKQDAKDLSRKVDAAVKPDRESASDKLSDGTTKLKVASSKAGVKLDQAALLAKVKTKLASDAGLSTLTRVEVRVEGSIVTLSGTVSSEEQKKAAELAASQVGGVTRVNNVLIVAP